MPEVIRNGITFVDGAADTALIQEIFDEDCYRMAEVPQGGLVVDGGGNFGTFALRCAVERGCHVIAYEPSPPNYEKFQANVLANSEPIRSAGGSVICKLAALAARARRATIHHLPDSPQASSLLPHEARFTVERFTVPVIPLRTAILQAVGHPARDRGFYLKLDIESAEIEVFAEEDLDYLRQADFISMEWHLYDGGRYSDQLRRLGFEVECVGGGCPAPPWDPTIARGLLYAKRVK